MTFLMTRRLAGTALGASAVAAMFAAPAVAQQTPIKIGFSMALTGTARRRWQARADRHGDLARRRSTPRAACSAARSSSSTTTTRPNPANVPKIYTKLLDVEGVDLVVSGYGTNVIAPAMPIVMRKKMVFMTLFGLAANEQYNYDRYFQIMPAGPEPREDWSRGFIRARQAKAAQDDRAGRRRCRIPQERPCRRAQQRQGRGLPDRLRPILSAEHDRLHPDHPRHPGDQSRDRLRRLLSAGFRGHGARRP